MEKIFGLTIEQIQKQSGKKGHEIDPQHDEMPIRQGETWEPCLRGAQKILNNPKEKEMMRRIYRR